MMSTSKQQFPLDEQPTMPAMPEEITSAQAKLVYFALLVTDEATATELQQLLGLSKLTLFAILEALMSQELIRRTEEGYASQ